MALRTPRGERRHRLTPVAAFNSVGPLGARLLEDPEGRDERLRI